MMMMIIIIIITISSFGWESNKRQVKSIFGMPMDPQWIPCLWGEVGPEANHFETALPAQGGPQGTVRSWPRHRHPPPVVPLQQGIRGRPETASLKQPKFTSAPGWPPSLLNHESFEAQEPFLYNWTLTFRKKQPGAAHGLRGQEMLEKMQRWEARAWQQFLNSQMILSLRSESQSWKITSLDLRRRALGLEHPHIFQRNTVSRNHASSGNSSNLKFIQQTPSPSAHKPICSWMVWL